MIRPTDETNHGFKTTSKTPPNPINILLPVELQAVVCSLTIIADNCHSHDVARFDRKRRIKRTKSADTLPRLPQRIAPDRCTSDTALPFPSLSRWEGNKNQHFNDRAPTPRRRVRDGGNNNKSDGAPRLPSQRRPLPRERGDVDADDGTPRIPTRHDDSIVIDRRLMV